MSEPFEGWRRLLSRASDLAGILWVGLAHWHIRVFWRIDGFSDRRGRGLGGVLKNAGLATVKSGCMTLRCQTSDRRKIPLSFYASHLT